jgi:FAD/FMN-containing dehydrogenase
VWNANVLIGGSVPVFDEIIISTSLMNQIISLDEEAGWLETSK